MSAALLKKRRTVQDILRKSLHELFIEIRHIESNNLTANDQPLLQAYIDTLESENVRLNEIHDEIIDLIAGEDDQLDEEIASQVSKHFKFGMDIRKAMSLVRNHIAMITKEKDSVSTNSDDVSASCRKNSAKLPKLNIKYFEGNPLHWKSFFDSFTHMIDKANISDVEKFSYLVSYLKGQAAETLSGLNLTNDNYKVALELLKKRFGDDQVLISAHMNALLKLDSVRSIKDIQSLRKSFDNIEAQIRSLQNLGVQSKQYGPMLIPILNSKFPDDLNLLISRKMGRGVWDINELLENLSEEIEARERLAPSSDSKVPYTTDALFTDFKFKGNYKGGFAKNNYKGDFGKNNSRSDFGKNNFRSDFGKKIKCVFCDSENHLAQGCTIITDIKTRKAIISNKGRCFKCIRTGHLSKMCHSNIVCYSCKDNHHAALCEKSEPEQEQTNSGFVSAPSKSVALLQTATAQVSDVKENNHSTLRILFDSGSQLSYITQRAKNLLHLTSVGKSNLLIKTFGKKNEEKVLDNVQFCVKGKNNSTVYVNALVTDICSPISGQLIEFTQRNYSYLQNIDLADKNCNGQDLAIDILIGANYYWSFMSGQVIKPDDGTGPIALESILGYILSGDCRVPDHFNSANVTLVQTSVLKIATEVSDKQILHEQFQPFWEKPEENVNSDSKIIQQFKDNLEFRDNRYQVKLPFKEDFDVINDNYTLSKGRLRGLYKTFKANPKLYEQYADVIDYQLKTGIVELVNESEPTQHGHVHYLPHRAVVRDDKSSTKVRVVFDASASSDTYNSSFPSFGSLNSCLYAGPSLTKSLFGVLLRFRVYNFAFVADIEKAFLQISLHPSHRDFARFLWFKDFDPLKQFGELELLTLRICRVLFGCTSSPFLLQGTLKEHVEKFGFDPVFVKNLLDSLHVDDLVGGGDSPGDTMEFYLKCVSRLAEASFKLKKFQSNDSDIEKNIVMQTDDDISLMNITTTKVLGIFWDKQKDVLKFDFSKFLEQCLAAKTKRDILHCIASLYDPVGLINPVLVKLKHYFQKLCIMKMEWDTELSSQLLDAWLELCNPFKGVSIVLTRAYCFWVPNNPIVDVQLHGFADASQKAYGACVYVRYKKQYGEVYCVLVASRSRIAPIKPQTIPRLELMGALVLAELINILQIELDYYLFSSVKTWTDSTAAFFWIVNNRTDQVFIRNRVAKILKLVPRSHWSLVGTKANPADIVSRGIQPQLLIECGTWFNGPEFLFLSEDQWPNIIADKLPHVEERMTVTTVTVADDVPTKLTNIFTANRYSSLERLLRITAYVLKFVNILKIKVEKRAADFTVSRPMSEAADDKKYLIEAANSTISPQNEYELVNKTADFTVSRSVANVATVYTATTDQPRKQYSLRSKSLVNQQGTKLVDPQAHVDKVLVDQQATEPVDSQARELTNKNELTIDNNDDFGVNYEVDGMTYGGKMNYLLNEDIAPVLNLWIKDMQKDIPEKRLETLMKQLNCFYDDKGIVRCKGRMENSVLTYQSKFPILLDGQHPLVQLLVHKAHIEVKHQRTKSTLTQLRAEYWLPKGRSIIKAFIHRCSRCKFFDSQPYNYPKAPALPKDRVTLDCPFHTVGLDYLGPLYVRDSINDLFKTWICLFTCSSTRALHLEVVPDNASPTFILAVRRFIGRRGIPRKVYSDNASTFTSQEVHDFIASVTAFATNAGINWTFNPPAAPWWGGFYERLVQLVKRCLRKILLKARVTLDELNTIVIEVESILNDRPLTYVDSELCEETLTPNHLNYGRRLNVNQSGAEQCCDCDVTVRYKYVNEIMNHFWKRFSSEYLTELRERHKHVTKRQSKELIKLNDVVLIKEDKLPRSKWRMAVVMKLEPSRDGEIRVATCKTLSNNKPILIKRTVNLLYPVET